MEALARADASARNRVWHSVGTIPAGQPARGLDNRDGLAALGHDDLARRGAPHSHQHAPDGFVHAHPVACHPLVGNAERTLGQDLLSERFDDTAAGADDVDVAHHYPAPLLSR